MRRNHIDNLRWMCIMLLFPFHIFMVYNSFGEGFYVKGADIKASTMFLFAIWPWFMPILFAVAGISASYALQKRSVGEYARERVSKLLVPLVAGILLVIPAQTYFAERFHNGYTGGYFAQYILFFTKPTDLTGYTGGFTPGHLWFILYLLVISFAAIPVVLLCRRLKSKPRPGRAPLPGRMPMPAILGLFILPVLGALVLDIGGKSLGEYFAWFMLGYFVLSDEDVQEKLEKGRAPLLAAGLLCMAFAALQGYGALAAPYPLPGIFQRFCGWAVILALVGLSRKHLDVRDRFTGYMSRSSFAVYLFHQTWVVASAYFALKITGNAVVQMWLILVLSVAATFLSYEICRRFKATRFLFAIKE